MMRAIRDNETAASAMGKDVTSRHRQVFIIGSAVIGIAGAMLTTLDGQFTPGSYIPLRFTFLIWVMVIIGGSGNNLGAIIGAFITWFVWVEAEPVALWLVGHVNLLLDETNPLRSHLQEVAPHMRMVLMGLILILVSDSDRRVSCLRRSLIIIDSRFTISGNNKILFFKILIMSLFFDLLGGY
ncbi:MAG: hypothetical protein CM1200mP30_11960 [Pseudomonadota bacterium]|nr:MAG: hypothetical protein CM1200mP30_11960 [Pseudomonadota bacterium]